MQLHSVNNKVFGHFFREMPRLDTTSKSRLGSVAGPVIQATGRSEFEDGLGSGERCVGTTHIT
jgi:hypothetical protein